MRPATPLIVALMLLASGFAFFGSPVLASTDDPIKILGDDDFHAQADAKDWPGSGTAQDPYIIEDLNITISSQPAVHIYNTQVHFILRNVSIAGSGISYGIFLHGVRNALVEDNTIKDTRIGIYLNVATASTIQRNIIENTQYGFNIITSNGNQIRDNNVTNQLYGFYVLYSSFNAIEGNGIADSSKWSVYVREGRQNLIHGNRITGGSQDGIHILDAHSNVITENVIHSSPTGIRILDIDNVVNRNKIFNAQTAIIVNGVSGVRLEWNEIRSSIVGISLSSAENTFFRGNDIRNGTYGIHLSSSNNNEFHGDTFVNMTTGILSFNEQRNKFYDLTLENNTIGLHLRSSRQNTFTDFYAKNNTEALRFDNSRGHIVQGGMFLGNDEAVVFYRGDQHEVRHNRFKENGVGLSILDSRDNIVWDNIFDNIKNVHVEGPVETQWNVPKAAGNNIIGGEWIGGNWWHDYSGMDVDGDGLGEIPHTPFEYGRTGSEMLAEMTGFPYGPEDQHPLMDTPADQNMV